MYRTVRFLLVVDLVSDLGSLADSVAQIVELRAANVAVSYNIDLYDVRGMNRKNALDAAAVRQRGGQ